MGDLLLWYLIGHRAGEDASCGVCTCMNTTPHIVDVCPPEALILPTVIAFACGFYLCLGIMALMADSNHDS